eukprot:TRINITY_DN62267_c0_g1_i1.p1 TRINITY_DN62267_c0_g1~~TRINITY_DN62267_c0_g1_i1.p1  ORF type:complete len:554 (+),score=139.12 TRINITY_DN62267_c0_g1_i1:251-1663(+)
MVGIRDQLANIQAVAAQAVTKQHHDLTMARSREHVLAVQAVAETGVADVLQELNDHRERLTCTHFGLTGAAERCRLLESQVEEVRSFVEAKNAEQRVTLAMVEDTVKSATARELNDHQERLADAVDRCRLLESQVEEVRIIAEAKTSEQRVTLAIAQAREETKSDLATLGRTSERQLRECTEQLEEELSCHKDILQTTVDSMSAGAKEQLLKAEERWKVGLAQLKDHVAGFDSVLADKASIRELEVSAARAEAAVAELHQQHIRIVMSRIEDRVGGVNDAMGRCVSEMQLQEAIGRVQEQVMSLHATLSQNAMQMVTSEQLRSAVVRLEEHISGVQTTVGQMASEHHLRAATSRLHQQFAHIQGEVNSLTIQTTPRQEASVSDRVVVGGDGVCGSGCGMGGDVGGGGSSDYHHGCGALGGFGSKKPVVVTQPGFGARDGLTNMRRTAVPPTLDEVAAALAALDKVAPVTT